MAIISGHGGDVTLGSTALAVTEWNATYSAEKIETTNQASGGNRAYILGPKGLEGSLTAQWDTTINGGAPPHSLVEPQEGVSFTLGLGSSNEGGTYTFTGVIESMQITSAFEGAIEYSCDFTASGAVTFTA